MLDDTDRRILSLLQADARTPNAGIARTIGLAASAVHQRIRKLEEAGVIRGYEARLDPEALGRPLASFVRVQTGPGAEASVITRHLAAMPEVQEVHRVVGEDCFFVKVRVQGPGDLANLLDERIQRVPGVSATRTTIVLQTTKETYALAIVEDDPVVEAAPSEGVQATR